MVLNCHEVQIIQSIIDEQFGVEMFAIDDWAIIDLLYKKHLVIYDKTRDKKPELQPWCRNTILRTLSNEQSGE